jgi:hypothetical protein
VSVPSHSAATTAELIAQLLERAARGEISRAALAAALDMFPRLFPTKPHGSRRIIGTQQLREKGITYALNHLRRLWLGGRFPRPFRLGEGQNGKLAWFEDEVDDYIARAAQKTALHDTAP